MKYSMQKIFCVFAVAAAGISALYTVADTAANAADARAATERLFNAFTQKLVRGKAEEVLRECQIVHRSIASDFDEALQTVRTELAELGAPQISGGYIPMKTSGVDGGESAAIEVPVPLFGETTMVPERDSQNRPVKNNPAAEVIFSRSANGKNVYVSLLSKVSATGEMLRIATMLKSPDGSPLLGTFPQDSDEPAALPHAMLARKTYSGVQKIGDSYFLSICEPVIDQYGELIAAIELLKKFDDLKHVFESLESVRIGENGYFWGLRISADGNHILRFCREARKGTLPPEDVKNVGELGAYTDDIVDAAISAGENKIVFRPTDSYAELPDKGGVETAFAYFKPWKMVVGATVRPDNFDDARQKILAAIDDRLALSIPVALVAVFVSALIAASFVSRLSTRPRKIMEAMADIKRLDELSAFKKLSAEYEAPIISITETENFKRHTIGLAKSVSAYVKTLSTLAGEISESAAKMGEKISAISAATEEKISKLNGIQNALGVIAKTAQVLNEDSAGALDGMGNSLGEMKDGASLLLELEENAKTLVADSQNVEFQLSEIKDKADRVAAVVSDIRTIGDRINMLSVNASVEAERSKDAVGFKSVAVEVAKLSDTTAAAAARISDTATGMCASVKSGVSEMKNFSLIMQSCRESVKNVRETISTAQKNTMELSPKFGDMSKSIYAHADNVAVIEENVNKLFEKAAESKNTAAELKADIETLAATAEAIRQRLQNFRPC